MTDSKSNLQNTSYARIKKKVLNGRISEYPLFISAPCWMVNLTGVDIHDAKRGQRMTHVYPPAAAAPPKEILCPLENAPQLPMEMHSGLPIFNLAKSLSVSGMYLGPDPP